MFKEQIQNNNSDHDRSYLTQTPACSMQCYQRLPGRRQQKREKKQHLRFHHHVLENPFKVLLQKMALHNMGHGFYNKPQYRHNLVED